MPTPSRGTGRGPDAPGDHGAGLAALFGPADGFGRARCQEVGPVPSLAGDAWTVETHRER